MADNVNHTYRTVIDHDKESGVALLMSPSAPQRFVVAQGYDPETESWSSGAYRSALIDAVTEYDSTVINERIASLGNWYKDVSHDLERIVEQGNGWGKVYSVDMAIAGGEGVEVLDGRAVDSILPTPELRDLYAICSMTDEIGELVGDGAIDPELVARAMWNEDHAWIEWTAKDARDREPALSVSFQSDVFLPSDCSRDDLVDMARHAATAHDPEFDALFSDETVERFPELAEARDEFVRARDLSEAVGALEVWYEDRCKTVMGLQSECPGWGAVYALNPSDESSRISLASLLEKLGPGEASMFIAAHEAMGPGADSRVSLEDVAAHARSHDYAWFEERFPLDAALVSPNAEINAPHDYSPEQLKDIALHVREGDYPAELFSQSAIADFPELASAWEAASSVELASLDEMWAPSGDLDELAADAETARDAQGVSEMAEHGVQEH